MTTRYECPISDCGWHYDATPPPVSRAALATVFGPGTLADIAAWNHRQEVEGEIRRHLEGHTPEDWVRAFRKHREVLASIGALHAKRVDAHGGTYGDCRSCDSVWPCHTWHLAHGYDWDECSGADWCHHEGVRL